MTVENVPGAGGSVGGDRVAKAAPDGTTLLLGRQRRAHDRPLVAEQADLRPGARSGADRARPRDA